MIDMLQGEGAVWTPMDPTQEAISECLEALDEDERHEFGCSWWHKQRQWESEAQARIIRQHNLRWWTNMLALAELDGDTAAASRFRMLIAAEEMGQEAEDLCRVVRSIEDFNALIAEQSA